MYANSVVTRAQANQGDAGVWRRLADVLSDLNGSPKPQNETLFESKQRFADELEKNPFTSQPVNSATEVITVNTKTDTITTTLTNTPKNPELMQANFSGWVVPFGSSLTLSGNVVTIKAPFEFDVGDVVFITYHA